MYCSTPKVLHNRGGGGGGVSPQPPPVCSIHLDDVTAATVQRRQCAHHTLATGGEEREWWSQFSEWGLLGGHDWQRPVEGIWPGHRGYTPTLYEKCHGINDHRWLESSIMRVFFNTNVITFFYLNGGAQSKKKTGDTTVLIKKASLNKYVIEKSLKISNNLLYHQVTLYYR